MKRLRCEFSKMEIVGFGIRVGYYPCLEGPYITLYFYRYRFDLWFGLESYWIPLSDRS